MLREVQVDTINPRITSAISRRDLPAVFVQELVVIDVVIISGKVVRGGFTRAAGPLREDRIAQASRHIDEVVAELAVAVGVAVIEDAVRMAGRAFVKGANRSLPTFSPNQRLGNDGEEAMSQLEVGRAQGVDVGIAGDRIEAEVRRRLARSSAVDIVSATVGVSAF